MFAWALSGWLAGTFLVKLSSSGLWSNYYSRTGWLKEATFDDFQLQVVSFFEFSWRFGQRTGIWRMLWRSPCFFTDKQKELQTFSTHAANSQRILLNIHRRYSKRCNFLGHRVWIRNSAALGALGASWRRGLSCPRSYRAARPTFRPISRRSPAPSSGERKEHNSARSCRFETGARPFAWNPKKKPVLLGMALTPACLGCLFPKAFRRNLFLSYACLAMYCRGQARAFPRDNFAHAFIICGGHRICGRGLVPVCSRLSSDPGILFMYAYTHKPLRAYVQPRGMNHSMPFYAKWQTFGVRRRRNLEPCSNDIFGRMPHCIPVRHPHEHKFHHLVQNHRLETRRATFCKIYLTPVRRYKVCPMFSMI